jgi:hypothetical protein
MSYSSSPDENDIACDVKANGKEGILRRDFSKMLGATALVLSLGIPRRESQFRQN